MTRTRLAALGVGMALIASPAPSRAQVLQMTPPLPVASPPSPAALETIRRLDASKIQDSGRGLEWVWIDVGGGFEQIGLEAFGGGSNFTGGLAKTSASGGLVSFAAGVRLLYFTILLRGRVNVSGLGDVYRVGPELGFHVPLGRLEPHVELGTGYGAVGNFQDEVGGVAAQYFSLRGGYLRLGGGVDYFVTRVVSIGASLSGEVLGLVRPGLTAAELATLKKALPAGQAISGDLGSTTSSAGATVALTAVVGFHF